MTAVAPSPTTSAPTTTDAAVTAPVSVVEVTPPVDADLPLTTAQATTTQATTARASGQQLPQIAPADVLPTLPPTGAEYLARLHDGRRVWFAGEEVHNVAAHPAFGNSARSIARLYDTLHHPPAAGPVAVATDTGSGFTHPYFKAPYSPEALREGLDGILAWARMSYGWMGRTPDYKASFLATLGSNEAHYSPFQDNARAWYKKAQESVLFVGHGIVNPPVDRHRPMTEMADVYITVDRETDAGIYVSGAKVVGTGAALTSHIFVGSYAQIPASGKKFSAFFMVPTAARGLKIISRKSYERTALIDGSPFDNPLSSRFDENDGIMVFDSVFVPWEDVFCYDVDKANAFFIESGFYYRAMMQACARFATKVDFLTGLLIKDLKITGTIEYRGVQSRLGELVSYRNTFWALLDSMVLNPTAMPDGTYAPNASTALAYRVSAASIYPRIRELFFKDLGSALIYNTASVEDFDHDEIRGVLDTYVRGNDVDALERAKHMKLTWDAIGSEFGSRHELYEMNYAGNHEQIRFETYFHAHNTGVARRCEELVEHCLSTYDEVGWLEPSSVSAGAAAGRSA